MSDVAYFKVYPGFDAEYMGEIINAGAKAVILEGYACGTLPAKGKLLPTIRKLSKKIPIFLLSGTQVPNDDGVSFVLGYGSQIDALNAGIIPLETSNSADFLDVINTLDRIIESSTSKDEIVQRMTSTYCRQGFFERLEKAKSNALTIIGSLE